MSDPRQSPPLPFDPDDTIGQSDYLRKRIAPAPTDLNYLAQSDLREALEDCRCPDEIDLLDYGSGGSPYRSLFPKARYRRADLAGTPDLDFVIEPGEALAAPDEGFDLILSTQVLEHVPDSDRYLRDCFRMLRPGGRLILSSHGTYPDHAVPFDYRRWTAEGIARDLQQAGFEVVSNQKLTTAIRCLISLLLLHGKEILAFRFTLFGFLPALMLRVVLKARRTFHRWADRQLAGQRIVEASEDGHRIYLGFLVQARKPGEPADAP